MDLFGKHQISFESIRRLAIECHALDAGAIELLVDTTVNAPGKIQTVYEELFSEKLLSLAVGIRTKFYQGTKHEGTEKYVSHCGFLFSFKDGNEKITGFSIKDICDKIIHADNLSRNMRNGTRHPITKLNGQFGKEPWELQFSTGLFCEGVLNWVESLEP
jgi:hypothetical protein